MARLFQIIVVATFVLFSTGLPITNPVESSDHLKSLMTGLRVFQQVFDNKVSFESHLIKFFHMKHLDLSNIHFISYNRYSVLPLQLMNMFVKLLLIAKGY